VAFVAAGGFEARQRLAQCAVERDRPAAALALAGNVREVDGVADRALGVGDHVPGQAADLLGAEPGLDAEQDHDAVALGIARVRDLAERCADLRLAKNLRLLALAVHDVCSN
jgi:hypothetical protein